MSNAVARAGPPEMLMPEQRLGGREGVSSEDRECPAGAKSQESQSSLEHLRGDGARWQGGTHERESSRT